MNNGKLNLNPDATKELPTQKVTVGMAAGALAMLLAWAFSEIAKVVVPAEIAIAFSIVLTFVAQHFIKGE